MFACACEKEKTNQFMGTGLSGVVLVGGGGVGGVGVCVCVLTVY